MQREEIFEEVCSLDFLSFKFGGRGYQDQLNDSIAKTSVLCGVKVDLVTAGHVKMVWVTHNFSFLGGSLGCAEGEKLTRAFEYGLSHSLPVVVQCRSGGARMQEGTSSLMQMAKVSVAVQALHDNGLPFLSILCDPTYGGVSASYAMQSDVKIAMTKDTRIGFAGPAVILNTMCEQNQTLFDQQCPPDFQAASFVYQNGQIDIVLEDQGDSEKQQIHAEQVVCSLVSKLMKKDVQTLLSPQSEVSGEVIDANSHEFNYTTSRLMDRPQTQDLISNLFADFVELSGDGKVGRDVCLKGGLASFVRSDGARQSCVVISTVKGHTPTDMMNANYGMPSPHGYRTAMRLMRMAEKFGLPVVTFVDTVGAWPTFECERLGQSEAIASNLTLMAGLKVPIVTVMTGEGGSGGALGICMGNVIAMLSGGYFGVISPEGAASILGRYKDEVHKAKQFPLDCQALATAQCIYAHQLKELGVVDEILWEEKGETFLSFPILKSRIQTFLTKALTDLTVKSPEDLVRQRYDKFRALGTFSLLDKEQRNVAVEDAKEAAGPKKSVTRDSSAKKHSLLIKHLAEEVVLGGMSKYRKLSPPSLPADPNGTTHFSKNIPDIGTQHVPIYPRNAKTVLDEDGPAGLCEFIRNTKRVLVTDTTMRDAHQSLLATRVRTIDLVEGARIASKLLGDAFSLEMWGGATFDVCMRFLDECPWERLRQIRKACPNVLLQMLIRGANAVGYTSYPDNVVEEFIRLSAVNGMDIFRIFDCFNIVDSMLVSINAVLKYNKIAEVCLCYTGNVLTSNIYDLQYYKQLAAEIKATGAHILGIKDMAGLLRPREVEPLMRVLREAVGDMPIHFHTHATSSGSLATCMEMAKNGCDIIDFATASMADGTSQPSLNAFVAMTEGDERDTGIKFLSLEPYDVFWSLVRDRYVPFESGMKSGTARVFEHQIPGGQYSNLLVQCQSMGLSGEQWSQVLDAYRDVNELFGDIVKVTPSSKCVGDLALYLVTRGITTKDLLNNSGAIDFPESVVGLLKGDLGFPHRGFPPVVEAMVLRDGEAKRTTRAGLTLPPVDFVENVRTLSNRWGKPVSEEQAMSSLMYPKVFSDYLTRLTAKGPLLPLLPSLIYFYAMNPGDSFALELKREESKDLFVSESLIGNVEGAVKIELLRVGSLNKGVRSVVFKLTNSSSGVSEEQSVDVKDSGGVFVFDGPMATGGNPNHVGSPMPGVVEKLLVKEGQMVTAGEMLFVVSAMKMEVKVTAPRDGIVASLSVPAVGYRVVEGALLLTLK